MGYYIGDKINVDGQNFSGVKIPQGIKGNFKIVDIRRLKKMSGFPQYDNMSLYLMVNGANKIYAWANAGKNFHDVSRVNPDLKAIPSN